MPRLRVVVLAVLVVLTGGLLFTSRTEAQSPPDLKSSALTVNDLGKDGWRMFSERTTADGLGYRASFLRLGLAIDPTATLSVQLNYDPDGHLTPLTAVEREIKVSRLAQQVFQRDVPLTYEFVPPALVGQDPVQARFTVQLTSIALCGDVLAWRRGAIVVTMTYLAPSNSHVVPYAETQDARLLAAGGEVR